MVINGETYSNLQVDNMQGLLEYFELSASRVAIEHNGKVLARGLNLSTISVSENDTIEFIHFAGGG